MPMHRSHEVDPATAAFVQKFYELLPQKVLDDEEMLWVIDIEPGYVAYAAKRITDWSSDGNIGQIPVVVCSRGGALDDALAVYSLLRYTPKYKRAYVFTAASAAVIVALACDERIGFPTTTILLHDLSTEFAGRGDYFFDEAEGIRLYQNIITEIITKRTKIPREVWQERRRSEWYMSAEEALRWGILTSIENEDELSPPQVPRKPKSATKKRKKKD